MTPRVENLEMEAARPGPTSLADRVFKQPGIVVYAALVLVVNPVLMSYVQLRYQNEENNPFQTHPLLVDISMAALMLSAVMAPIQLFSEGRILKTCVFTRELRSHISSWLRVDIPDSDPRGVMEWLGDLQISKHNRGIIEMVIFTWWWHVWKDRNNLIHKKKKVSTAETFQSIVSLTFLWAANRDRKRSYGWLQWISCPTMQV